MKVVETFDRAHNLREVKLVYSTLIESFGSKQTKTEIKESKGSSFKYMVSTKSEKQEVISEGHELRDRFKKLIWYSLILIGEIIMSNHKNLGVVEKLMDGYNPYVKDKRKLMSLIKKWEPTGLLEGIRTEQKVLE